jgi:tetratricopeptide (TPR) repeat protein
MLILLALLAATGGCKKFLAEQSQNLAYANTAAKLEEVINGDGYMPHFTTPPYSTYQEQGKAMYFPWLNCMDDDFSEFVSSPIYPDDRSSVFGFYTWQSNPFESSTYVISTDDTWAKTYVNINAVNIIAQEATKITDNPAELQRIRGEALFLRAFYYFYLVNVYAPAYNKATAGTDPGVPLKTTEFVQDNFFTRSTTDSVYRQIVADLSAAEICLDTASHVSLYHADINAVNLLQSRVYLYMQDWADAITAANKVISRKPQLFDLNGYQPHTSFFSAGSPEAIFTQGGNAMIYLTQENYPMAFQASDDLMNLYQLNDLRRTAFFEVDQLGKTRYAKMYQSTTYNVHPSEIFSDNYFLRNAEAYLNKAEASAMLGKTDDANAAINVLTKSRFKPADYTPINLAEDTLVSFIRDERRRELCFEGQRWFDLKRYTVNTQYPFTKTIAHTWSNAVAGGTPYVVATLTLQPGDPDYLVPLPLEAITFNQGALIQNPARQDRTF